MRVLLIEDDTATAQSIELMLKSEGFNVYTTDLGKRASISASSTTTTSSFSTSTCRTCPAMKC
jgi:DNA-binding response OmpR family regulator